MSREALQPITPKTIGVVGSGSAIIGFLYGLGQKIKKGEISPPFPRITIFEKSAIAGSGLPYDASMTSPEHLFNVHIQSGSILPIIPDSDELRADRDGFINWLQKEETKKYLRSEFEKIFFERFKRAYKIKFGNDYKGKNIFGITEEEEKENSQSQDVKIAEMISFHRGKFNSYVEKIEKDAKNQYGFLPRIVYGFYSKALFDYQVRELEKLGVQVVVRTETEVTSIAQGNDERVLLHTQSAKKRDEVIGEQGYVFVDNIFMASGLWQEEKSPYKNPNYVHNIWPADKVEELIEAAIKKAKEEHRDSIHIAIKGTSLSAVDMMRTCFKDGTVVDGVKIYVDMCSRGGRFQAIKGNFRWLNEEVQQYMPQALERVFANRRLKGFKKTEPFERKAFFGDLITNITTLLNTELQKDNNNPKQIHLWQVLDLFLEILQAAYECNNLTDKAEQIEDLRNQVIANKENYQATILLMKSLQKENPFEQLEEDLKSAKDGDKNQNGNYIFQHIFDMFDYSASYVKNLPADEKMFLKHFGREFMGPFSAAMPAESGEDILDKAGSDNLKVRALGRKAKFDIPHEGQMKIIDSAGKSKDYDIIINAGGVKISKDTSSTLYKSVNSPEFESKLDPEKIEMQEKELKEMQGILTEKYGAEYAEDMLGNIIETEDGKLVYVDGFLSRSGVTEIGDSAIISHATSGIFSAFVAGQIVAADKIRSL